MNVLQNSLANYTRLIDSLGLVHSSQGLLQMQYDSEGLEEMKEEIGGSGVGGLGSQVFGNGIRERLSTSHEK